MIFTIHFRLAIATVLCVSLLQVGGALAADCGSVLAGGDSRGYVGEGGNFIPDGKCRARRVTRAACEGVGGDFQKDSGAGYTTCVYDKPAAEEANSPPPDDAKAKRYRAMSIDHISQARDGIRNGDAKWALFQLNAAAIAIENYPDAELTAEIARLKAEANAIAATSQKPPSPSTQPDKTEENERAASETDSVGENCEARKQQLFAQYMSANESAALLFKLKNCDLEHQNLARTVHELGNSVVSIARYYTKCDPHTSSEWQARGARIVDMGLKHINMCLE